MLFLKIMLTEFIAEMGDKTQLMLIAMASKFKLKDIILGTAVAVMVLNGIAILAGGLIGSLIPTWVIKLIATVAFLYFALTSLKSDDDEEEEGEAKVNFKFAPVTVFCTFFVAELGDKTQLTAMTFGANEGLSKALIVWAACSIGLFMADVIGMLMGNFLKSKMPEGILNTIAFAILSVYGFVTLDEALKLLSVESPLKSSIIAGVIVVYVIVCILINRSNKKTSDKVNNKENA